MDVRLRIVALLGGLLLLGMGCSGLTENLVEMSTGAQMDIDEEGNVTMTMPDGSTIVTQQGADVPDDWPLPEPFEGAEPQALVTNTNAAGQASYILTYDMKAPRDEIRETYKAWLDANGTDVKVNKETPAGMVSETLTGKVGNGLVVVTLTEAYGANSVSVIWSPSGKDALPQQGM